MESRIISRIFLADLDFAPVVTIDHHPDGNGLCVLTDANTLLIIHTQHHSSHRIFSLSKYPNALRFDAFSLATMMSNRTWFASLFCLAR